MASVAVVEDNDMLRQMMSEVIKADPKLNLAGIFTSAEEFLVFFEKNKTDIVIMDIGLPGMTGFRCEYVKSSYFMLYTSAVNVF